MQVGDSIEVQDSGGTWRPATVLEVAQDRVCVLVDWYWLAGTSWAPRARCRALQRHPGLCVKCGQPIEPACSQLDVCLHCYEIISNYGGW